MRFAAIFLAATAGLAAAQSVTVTSSAAVPSTSSPSNCAAQDILDACLTSTKAILASCAANDYGCLCDQYTNVLTCYNNCPDDPGRFGIQQEVTQNCAANKAYGTTSTIPKDTATKTTATSAAASTGTGTAVTTGFGTGSSSTGTSSGSASGSTHTGAAQRVVVSGGLVGLAGGVFGLLL